VKVRRLRIALGPPTQQIDQRSGKRGRGHRSMTMRSNVSA
jgi:hypothetical protein